MQPLPRPIRAVLLDLDGTLIDTEPAYRAAFLATLQAFGRTLATSDHDAMIGLPTPERRVILARHLGSSFPLDAFFAAYYRHRSAALAGGIPLKPGVDTLLATISTLKIPVAVATSASRATALAHLSACGLLTRIGTLVTRDDVAAGKPAPDSYLRAAAELGVPPHDCLAVEDSANGATAALAAGAMTVIVPDRIAPTVGLSAGCTAILPDLHAVADLLLRSIGIGEGTERSHVRCPTREPIAT